MDLSPLWVSIKTAAAAAVLAFGLGLTAARWMWSYRGRGRRLIDAGFTLPLVLPPTVTGFLLLLLLGRQSWVGRGLQRLGIELIFTWGAAVLAATVVAFPLVYKTALAAFEQVDHTLVEAARTLGAREGKIFWLLLLPLAWPGLLAGLVLAFSRALGEFGATLMVGGSIPGATRTIPIEIFFAAEAGRMGQALIWVLAMVALALGVVIWLGSGPGGVGRWLWGFDRIFFKGDFKLTPGPAVLQSPATGSLEAHVYHSLPEFDLAVSLDIASSPLGLLGISGAGKSMTLRCLAGLETPRQGRIVLNGRVLFDSARKVNVPSCDRSVGLVFQNYALFPHLSVAQNIAFALGHVPVAQRAARVTQQLQQLELATLAARYPGQLSGGQQQRVALARALAARPQLLLLDEPLAALDTHLRHRTLQLLDRLLMHHGGPSLMVSHNLEELYHLCPQIAVVDRGHIAALGPREQIFETPPTRAVARVTGCENIAAATVIGSGKLFIPDWQITVHWPGADFSGNYVGIRAHQIRCLATEPPALPIDSCFPGWPARHSVGLQTVTLYVKLGSTPLTEQDYHLQVKIPREIWNQLQLVPPPWRILLPPECLLSLA